MTKDAKKRSLISDKHTSAGKVTDEKHKSGKSSIWNVIVRAPIYPHGR